MTVSRHIEPFVGRGKELSVLRSAVDRAAGRQGQVVTIAGEPGIGKTALARAVMEYSASENFLVGMGRCREQRDAPPFWPWTQALRSAAYRPADHASEAAINGLLAVAEKLSAERADTRESRFGLFVSTIDSLRPVCDERPLFLLLDDLQWSDAASMELLEFCTLELESLPLAVVCTFRSNEAEQNESLISALSSLSRESCYTDIDLHGLDRQELTELFRTAARNDDLVAEPELLESVSGGNPFFVKELAARGARNPADSLKLVEGAGVPDAIRNMIRRRMRTLPADSHTVLQIASVIGETFSIDRVRDVMGLPGTADVLDLLHPAEQLGLVQADTGIETWRFHHAITRYAVAESIGSTERVRLHLKIAESLEQEWEESRPELAAELAHHFEQAQVIAGPERVFKYSLAAGIYAIRTLAFADAHSHLVTAEKLLTDRTSEEAANLLEGLCLAKMAMGAPAVAFKYQRSAFDLWVALGRTNNAVRTAGYPIPGAGGQTIIDMTQQALEIAEPDSLNTAHLMSRALWLMPRPPSEKEELFKQALEILSKHRDPVLEIWLRGRWGGSWTNPGNYETAIEELDKAIALGPIAQDPEAETHARYWAALACGAIGRSKELKHHVAECHKAGRRSRRAMRMFQWARIQVFSSAAHAEYEELDDVFAEIVDQGAETGQEMPALQAVAWAEQGRIDDARQLLFQEWDRKTTVQPDGQSGSNSQAMASLRFSDITGNEELVGRSLATLEHSGIIDVLKDHQDADSGRSGIAPWLFSLWASFAFAAPKLSPEQLALMTRVLSRYSRVLVPDSGGQGLVNYPLSLDRVVGRLHAVAGDSARAMERFDIAIEFCESAGYRAEAVWSHCDRVAYALDYRLGLRRKDAEASIAAAKKIATTVGMNGAFVKLDALESRLDELRDGRSRPVYPDGLTEREVEVLRELAHGRSNREIAEALFISQNTVIRHVSNIFSKTGCANRAEAAAYAERVSLAG